MGAKKESCGSGSSESIHPLQYSIVLLPYSTVHVLQSEAEKKMVNFFVREKKKGLAWVGSHK